LTSLQKAAGLPARRRSRLGRLQNPRRHVGCSSLQPLRVRRGSRPAALLSGAEGGLLQLTAVALGRLRGLFKTRGHFSAVFASTTNGEVTSAYSPQALRSGRGAAKQA